MTIPTHKSKGFTLVELMISLALGLIISGAIIQILVSNSTTDALNRAIASTQESGRFIVSRMRQELMMTGLYDAMDPNLSSLVDNVEEEAFVRSHPVPVPGDFVSNALLGARQGVGGANDTLVISLQAERDCRGFTLGYPANEEFYVVNEYFVNNGRLLCRGFDGRVLRGQKAPAANAGDAAFTLLDNVLSFQVLYGITDPNDPDRRTIPIRYIDASALAAAYAANAQVVTIRLAIVIRGDADVNLDAPATFTLLNEAQITAPDNGYYRAFETTVTLRNMRNFARGNML
ncbi:PilW family protein [Glaciecola siphonariae]|uniref:PilW family protein n=1 Tax=Glaciecola siphonariae TaxID=521012 RepID=A0ABV9LZ50_9ALTE